MRNFVEEKSLKIKELIILSKIDAELFAKVVVKNLVSYFDFKDVCDETCYSVVFNYIYVKRVKINNWKLANICSVSESTLFRIRHEITDCFYKRYDYDLKRNIEFYN